MLSVILVIIGLSFLILVHELGHFLSAKWFGIGVEEFGIGFPPRIVSKKISETRYSINWLPLGGFVKLKGEFTSSPASTRLGEAGQDVMSEFIHKPIWQRAIVLVAGVAMNFVAGWALLAAVFMIGVPTAIVIHDVVADSPAAVAGIEPGDRITGFASAKEFVDFIAAHSGETVAITIQHPSPDDGHRETRVIEVVPDKTIGVMLTDAGVPAQSWWKAIVGAFVQSWFVLWSILTALGSIFYTPEAFVGPVGIFNIAIETGRLGAVYVVHLLAIISLNLVVLNLLPVPALDGGRLLFLLIEKIRRKKFLPERESFWNGIGFAVLLVLIIAVTVADLARLLQWG